MNERYNSEPRSCDKPAVYEYRCFWCGHTNRRLRKTRRIVCDRCGKAFGA